MSYFKLEIDTDRSSMSNPYGEDRPTEAAIESYRRKQVANLLETVALMLRQGRDMEKIRDHNGSVVGCYTLRHA